VNMFRYWPYLETTTEGGAPGGGMPAPPPTNTNPGQTPAAGSQPPQGTPPATTPAGTPPQASWPEMWRQNLAGSDEAELKRLERFAAPGDIYKSFRALEKRLSSGELKAVTPFPEKGTDQEKNAWRAENGIPESHDKYEINLSNGLVLGDDDAPIVDDFKQFAHKKNLPNAAVSAGVEWYAEHKQKQQEQRALAFKQKQQQTEEQLRQDWGADYRPNITSIESFLDSKVSADSDLKDLIMRGVQTNAEFAQLFAGIVREINPVTTILPGSNSNPQLLDNEIESWEKKMGDKSSDYWKGPNAEKNQERYRKLLEARDKARR